jgi:hypothetical protein
VRCDAQRAGFRALRLVKPGCRFDCIRASSLRGHTREEDAGRASFTRCDRDARFACRDPGAGCAGRDRARRRQGRRFQQLSCGDTITTDATLHHNLVNCPNNGIIIGADNVTLDLSYHTIDGDGTPAAGCGPQEDCDLGLASIGHDGVTVTHGRVREFAIGVAVASEVGKTRHNRVLDISSSKNHFFGIGIFSAARSVVRNSSGSSNPPPEGDGMGLFGAHHVRILHSSFRHNALPGIHLADSSHNLIKGTCSHAMPPESCWNTPIAIGCDATASFETVPPSSLPRHGKRDRPKPHLERRGRHRDREGTPQPGRPQRHCRPSQGRGLPRTRSTFDRRPRQRCPPKLRQGKRRGRVPDQGGDRHSRLKRNIAKRAGDDGFDIESRSTKLTRNEARRNGDLGVEAVRGVVDGGGNKASGNGDLRQCANIVCR